MTRYYKVSGSGNDFLALVEPERNPDSGSIAAWCRRGLSIGADGLFTLRREGPAVRMEYWNADGLGAALCINGTRCAARLAMELGWVVNEVQVLTGAGPIAARAASGERISLEFSPPSDPPSLRRVEALGEVWEGYFQMVGVPHFVILWPHGMASVPVATLGAALRHHPAFAPDGANVNFIRYPGPDHMEIRSFERGVEAETLACGSGVLAAAAVGVDLGKATLPLEVLTAGGFRIEVRGEVDGGRIRSWEMAGDARILADGTLHEGAAHLPPAAQWS
ncbi:MAG TPA: diaminopimelate epimerase [Kofleriaceae bacterium]|jgi:diaminopimelate epimerase